MHRHTSLDLHLQEGGSACPGHLSLRLVFHGLDPSRASINFVDDQLVVLDTAGSMGDFHIWSMCIVPQGLWMMSLLFLMGAATSSFWAAPQADPLLLLFWLFAASRAGVSVLVDYTHWRCNHRCPFWISLDSGKYLLVFLKLTRGQNRQLFLWMALRQVAMVGNPAAPRR